MGLGVRMLAEPPQAAEWGRFQRWLAVAAGAANWPQRRVPSSADLAVGCLEGAALGGILTVAVSARSARGAGLSSTVWLAAALTVALAVIAAPTVWWLVGRSHRWVPSRALQVIAAVLRAGAFAAGYVLFVLLVGGVRPYGAWLFGMVAGCEAALVARAVGGRPRPWRWWRRSWVSCGHVFAVVVASATALALRRPDIGVSLYLTIQVAVAVAVFEVWVIDTIGTRLRSELRQHVSLAQRREHRQRARWLHDDVCSELHLMRLKLEAGAPSHEEIAAQLAELDHRLRVHQLDELLRSGPVRVAELVQPFVRRAQTHGVRVRLVLSPEDAAIELEECVGWAFQRAAAVLVTNALQAGASDITIHVAVDAAACRVDLRVDDDAGGFEVDAIPEGRGLDSLRAELGDDALELRRTPHGTTARVAIPFGVPQEVS